MTINPWFGPFWSAVIVLAVGLAVGFGIAKSKKPHLQQPLWPRRPLLKPPPLRPMLLHLWPTPQPLLLPLLHPSDCQSAASKTRLGGFFVRLSGSLSATCTQSVTAQTHQTALEGGYHRSCNLVTKSSQGSRT